jgi:catechol 2,3-dioxygenase
MPDTLQSTAVRFAPRRLGHANLFVGELERSMRFYVDVCGIEEVRREPGIAAGFLSNGSTHHDVGLMQASGAKRIGRDGHVQVSSGRGHVAGLNHFGWEMDTEAALVSAWQRAQAAAVEVHRLTDHQISHSVYMFDPEGNLHEFYADALKNWRSIFNPSREDLVSGDWNPDAAPPMQEPNWDPKPEMRRVPGAVFHPTRVTHAGLAVRDLGGMRAFFTEIGGLEPVPGGEAEGIVLLRGAASPGPDLVLIEARNGIMPGIHHTAYQVASEEELLASERAARDKGIEIELILDRPSKRSIFVRDPDRMLIEFYVRRDAAREDLSRATPALRPYLA